MSYVLSCIPHTCIHMTHTHMHWCTLWYAHICPDAHYMHVHAHTHTHTYKYTHTHTVQVAHMQKHLRHTETHPTSHSTHINTYINALCKLPLFLYVCKNGREKKQKYFSFFLFLTMSCNEGKINKQTKLFCVNRWSVGTCVCVCVCVCVRLSW